MLWNNVVRAAIKMWRKILMVAIPIMFLPFLNVSENGQMWKCAYVVLIMSLYWIVEPIPLGATSMIPVALLPLLGLMRTEEICDFYMNETNMMFIGTLTMAIAIEHSNLHQRLALKTLCLTGAGIRRLVLGLMLISMFLAIWINNVAITAMMMPVVDSLVVELFGKKEAEGEECNDVMTEKMSLKCVEAKQNGYAKVPTSEKELVAYQEECCPAEEVLSSPSEVDGITIEQCRKRIRVLFYLSVVYGANTGAITTITSAPSNIIFKFVIEDLYKDRAPVDYASWMFFAIPITVLSTVLFYFAIIALFFWKRPEMDRCCTSGSDIIRQNYKALGPIRFHEVAVGSLFLLLVFLWIFRDPMFAKGWATYFGAVKPKDATAAMMVVVLLFMIPAQPTDIVRSPPLVSWRLVQAKLQWSVILLVGSGFALAESTRVCGLSQKIGHFLGGLGHLQPFVLMIVLAVICSVISEVICNAGLVTLLLPIFATLAEDLNINPLLLMVPATITSNFCFILPVGTPANTIAYEHAHLKISDMVLPGFVVKLITMFVTVIVTYALGDAVFGMFENPEWVVENTVHLTGTLLNSTLHQT
ncbi:Na(+)/citrate cotransporter-like [Ornithodoros turicata]|uniref:Na(+)/citrate cotransporter-like n=1 Tax=Ornithodoros turicata TaxID=34597 RepID=UPI003139889F